MAITIYQGIPLFWVQFSTKLKYIKIQYLNSIIQYQHEFNLRKVILISRYNCLKLHNKKNTFN